MDKSEVLKVCIFRKMTKINVVVKFLKRCWRMFTGYVQEWKMMFQSISW